MAYGFNEDRSKVEVYTQAEIDAMDLADNQALSQEVTARQAGDRTINARVSNIIADGQQTEGNTELIDIRTGFNGAIYTTAGDAVRSTQTNIDNIVERYSTLDPYLYKRNTYINNNGEDVALDGYDTYKIPVSENDLLHFIWIDDFWYNLNPGYTLKLEKSDNTYVNLSSFTQHETWFYISGAYKEGIFLFPSGYDYFVLTVYRDRLSNVSVNVNNPHTVLRDGIAVQKRQTAIAVNADCAFRTKFYFHNNGEIQNLSGNYYALWMPVKTGDKINFSSIVLSYYATFHSFNSGTTTNVTVARYTAAEDGVLCVFQPLDETSNAMLIAADSIKIDSSNIINADASFDGIAWVSFGDSITYRESWQPYVIDALGVSHVNCGIGSTALSGSSSTAFWQDVRLDAVKAANPDIVTILGGANDIVMNPNIGDETNLVDKDTSTFIGAYSYIIDNLKTWKPSLKIIILGTTWAHNNGTDVSQTLTYKDFSDACELVADYYQLPFIDLWSNSGFNKYTMNNSPYNIYSNDHIHPNDAGGKIIAAQVIAKMREIYGVN